MQIQSMFKDDINRKINGVVKVDQDESDVLVQELSEYVVTKELKKHFIAFFDRYTEALAERTADVGVWISGFFGSGKSHFLKILSYLMENREVQGVPTVERFREKFADDPGTFMNIDKATRVKADTILFNIDIEGSINKDKTAVLRVFAKMFYNHLGFYGEDLKVAKLEQFIAKKGKTEEFQRAFAAKAGDSWLDARDGYAFREDDMAATLQEVLGMSEEAARNWLNGAGGVETSIAQLVSEIKDYVAGKPEGYRLLFMVDEVGQYVGGDTDLLLNLQSLVEEIGSKCLGKVWVVCTGQEAIDEIIKARENEFSRIQARFKTRLSLSSSSADEVIQKRILQKTDAAGRELEQVYAANDSVLRNLFTFNGALKDIKGFGGPDEFAKDFPFVPYQFILMQKVFAEIRKHGNSGKHLSGGERSMLSGFQEAAQKIEDKDERALAPFYLFYDTVHTFLDSTIRQVIERCQRAADDGNGIEPQDVDVLKLLYLVRYVDDVQANLDNLVILMADEIGLDKVAMRERVRASLDRLLSQNYIGRTGDTYNFLTDEEQDVQREIKNTPVSAAEIVGRIAQMAFDDVYASKKFRHGKYDFAFDRMVDNQAVGPMTDGMCLRLLTVAADPADKEEVRLLAKSSGQAIVVLADTPYYESLESAMKIRKYVKQRNVSQLAKSMQDIIRNQQDEATRHEEEAHGHLEAAIVGARYYADGERLTITTGGAKARLDAALERLVAGVYSSLDLVAKFAESDADVRAILMGQDESLEGMNPNREAIDKVKQFLEMQAQQLLPTTMADVQDRYQKKPYGWREIDVAALVATLVHEQAVTVKRGGEIILPDNPRLPEMLRKKSEIASVTVAIRQAVSQQKARAARDFLRDYFDAMDVPEDEDGLVAYAARGLAATKEHYSQLLARYQGHAYPDKDKVGKAISLTGEVLSQQKDNLALIQRLLDRQEDLLDAGEAMQKVEEFFKSRVAVFDAAADLARDYACDAEYLEPQAAAALAEIRQITAPAPGEAFHYDRIPSLNDLMRKAKAAHDVVLKNKREEARDIAEQCVQEIRHAAAGHPEAQAQAVQEAGAFADKIKQIDSQEQIAVIDGLIASLWKLRDDALKRIKDIIDPPPAPKGPENLAAVYVRQLFPARVLRSETEIDAYLDDARAALKKALPGHDGVKLN